jgi:peptidoglycan-N-acetylglucosamine deacetylase
VLSRSRPERTALIVLDRVMLVPKRVVRRLGRRWRPWRVVDSRRKLRTNAVALTFDDGPSTWTGPILEALEAGGAHGTFFVLGDAIAGREANLTQMRDNGHEVGNHSRSHARLDLLDPGSVRAELEYTNHAIADVLGHPPRLFRPPHYCGSDLVHRIAAELGLPIAVYASVWPEDWNAESGEEIAEHVLTRLRPGSIVTLHDGRPATEAPEASRADREPTLEAVRRLVPALVSSGFQLVTVSELLAL